MKNLNDEALNAVCGGATVVEIPKREIEAVHCFSCGSPDVVVEQKGAYISVTCKKCGAVDLRAAK